MRTKRKNKISTKNEYITVHKCDCTNYGPYNLDAIVEIANRYKPEGYSKLTSKDIYINLDKDIDYGYYNDIDVSIIMEIDIKNKDYIKK